MIARDSSAARWFLVWYGWGLALLAGWLALFCECPLHAQPGSLDYDFVPNSVIGVQLRDFDLQPDGRIVIAGEFKTYQGFARAYVARVHADGRLDKSFDPGEGPNSPVRIVRVTSEGKILIAGDFLTVQGVPRVGLARLNGDGSLDPSFAPGGYPSPTYTSLALQPDGQIIAAGTYWPPSGTGSKPLCQRFTTNGSVDPGFHPDPGRLPWIESSAIQSDGKILLAGTAKSFGSNSIVRLRGDGSFDKGSWSPPFPSRVESLALLGGGEIVAVGDHAYGSISPRIVRFTRDLNPDPSFDIGAGFNHLASTIAVRRDGRLIVGGAFATYNGVPSPGLAGLYADGRFDSSFQADFGRETVWVEQLLVQPDGKLLIAGVFSSIGPTALYGFARLHMDDLVLGAPRITRQPTNVAVFPGTEVTLFVGTASYVRPSFQWRFNGASFPSGTNALLTLPNVQPEQAGDYDVVVSNPEGFATSLAVRMDVYRPPLLLREPADVSVRAGEPAEFVVVAEGTPAPAVWWQFNGAPLLGETNLTLALPHVTRASDGIYSVILSNIAGVVTSSPARLAVLFPPEIVSQPIPLTVDAGESAWLLVQAEAEPAPSYQWWRNETPLPLETYSQIVFYPVASADSATYSVVISNVLGAVTSAPVALVVRTYAPIIREPPVDQTVMEGRPARFSAAVAAAPPGTFQWRFNGVDIPGAVTSELSLAGVRFNDAGAYSLLVSNDVGWSESPPAVLRVIPASTNPGDVDVGFDPGAGPDEPVKALALQPDGKVVMVGEFTEVAGARRNGVARLNADGSIDTGFDPGAGPDAKVLSVAVQRDGRVLIGGEFQRVSGEVRNYLARLEPDGRLDMSFDASDSLSQEVDGLWLDPDGLILTALSVPPTYQFLPRLLRLLPGGDRDQRYQSPLIQNYYQGGTQDGPGARPTYALTCDFKGRALVANESGLFRYLPAGATDLAFPRPDESPAIHTPYSAFCVAVQPDGAILFGGTFATIGPSGPGLARVHSDGTADVTFTPRIQFSSPRGPVKAIMVQPDGRILIGGAFTNINGAPRRGLARLNRDGSLDEGFSADLIGGGAVSAIVLRPDCRILIAGSFTNVGGVLRRGVALLHGDPIAAPSILTPPASQTVLEGREAELFVEVAGCPSPRFQWQFNGTNLAQGTNSRLALSPVRRSHAGQYTAIVSNSFGQATSVVATITVSLGSTEPGCVLNEAVTPFGADGPVLAMAVQDDGKLLIGGAFAKVMGLPRRCLARLNQDGSLDLSFDPGSGVIGQAASVNALAFLKDGKLLIGGTFQSVGGLGRTNLARLNRDGSVDDSFNPSVGPDGSVYALLLQTDGRVVVGGAFSRVGNQDRLGLARLQLDGSLDPGFNPAQRVRIVYALAQNRSGDILIGGGPPLLGFGTVFQSVRQDGSLNFAGGPTSAKSIYAMALMPDDSLIVGGGFSNIGGVPRSGIARLSTNGLVQTDLWSSVTASGPVRALLRLSCGAVMIGGTFDSINGVQQIGLARLLPDGRLDEAYSARGGADGTVFGLAQQWDGNIAVGGAFSRLGGSPRGGLGRLVADPFLAPTVRLPNASHFIKGGTDLTLTLESGCWPRSTFQWYLNGAPLSGQTTASMTITNFKFVTEGDYAVSISNALGQAVSEPVTLRANQPVTAGSLDLDFVAASVVPGFPSAVGVDGSRRILVAFPTTNDFAGRFWWRVIRLHPNGTLDPTFHPVNLQGGIRALAVQADGQVIIGGSFSGGLTRWNGDGTAGAGSFTSQFSGQLGVSVEAIALDRDGGILVGGDLVSHAGVSTPGIARLLPSGELDRGFAVGLGANGEVFAVTVQDDGRILMAGAFTSFDGAARRAIVRLQPDGAVDHSFEPDIEENLAGSVRALALQKDGRILIGGNLTVSKEALVRTSLVRLEREGAVDWSFNSALPSSDSMRSILVQADRRILVAFRVYAPGYLFRVLESGTIDPDFTRGRLIDGGVEAMMQQKDGRVLIAGGFKSVNLIPRVGLARLLGNVVLFDPSKAAGESGGAWSASIATVGGKLYTLESKGAFTDIAWIPRSSEPGDGDVKILTDPELNQERRFYRVRVE